MLNRPRKILLGIAAAVVAAIGFAALWVNSPEQYRTTLQDYVATATGYELVVAGAIDLNLLPVARLTLEDARLRNPGLPQELASAAFVQLDVDRGDLLRGELTIRELRIDGFHVNAYVDATGTSIWHTGPAETVPIFSGESDTASLLPERIAVEGGRLDVQNLFSGRRFLLKNLRVVGDNVNLQGESFPLLANFDVEWFDSSNRRLREAEVGLSGNVEADANSGGLALADLDINSTPVLLQGRLDVTDFPADPSYRANLTSNEFDARTLLQNLGWLVSPEQSLLSAPNGNADGQWPAELEFNLSGDSAELNATASVSSSNRLVIEAETELRFARGLAPANVRYEVDIGELDISELISGQGEPADGGFGGQATSAFPRHARVLPNLENLNLSGSISAKALTAGVLRVENLTIFTNVEDQVLDMEIPPAAALDGTVSANMRWNARSGDMESEFHGEELAISDIAPLVTRFDVLTGRLHIDGAFGARGQSLNELLHDLSGNASFIVTENLVNIGLIKQIFTSISALSPSGETIQQWPDLIRFSEISGGISLDGGLASDHAFNLRMDNFSAAGAGFANLQTGQFDYDALLTMLGEPFTQTIPVSGNYQSVTWPVECAARFSDEVDQFCRPDFSAVREIFSRINDDASAN